MSAYSHKEDCSGCTACSNICPTNAVTMLPDSEGFLYPEVSSKLCINCGLCKQVCRFNDNYYHDGINLATPDVYAVKNKEDGVRLKSTSGGVFTAISDYFIINNGVVFGAAFDNELNVCHQKATTTEERDKLRGSKYIQSDLGQNFCEVEKLLLSGKHVLFSGTPCQIAGLRGFLGRRVDQTRLFLCDLVCHGTPSPLLWKEHKKLLETKYKSKIISYNFRSKWRGVNVSVGFANGKKITNTEALLTYINIYYLLTALRPSCYNCKFTNLKRPSDITIADFWGIEKCLPEFDDEKGVSLVLVNTSKGRELFKYIERDLLYMKSNIHDCLQPNLQYPSFIPPNRTQFWLDYYDNSFNYIIKKYAHYGIKAQIRKFVRRIFSKLIKIIKTRIS